ncbi:Os05g0564500 [Oryza sativa Japonica Group]|uniref:Os05g0564500 protein n=1 Tax=Oryza sativa subsp. japonica TaxID=39947 RepID=C7J2I0_ORYSJ|nr:Os05g0564500 [Oryza sativa Japonica Group]|eukprot:NP_001174527.1 Os05g0564500 [Oryza sativa Japonica Group]
MASPNRHWPSMFRSNLACNIQQQQQPDMNGNGSSSSSFLLSPPTAATTGNGKPSLLSSGCEEGTRNPEPKPRWNPRPEQIRILEGIFNSGMVNPPRDEIRRIRLQLQEYGQVGDANVFYWFQNRKSRTKNKLRAAGHHHHHGRAAALPRASAPPSTNIVLPSAAAAAPLTPPRRHLLAATSSSSSSSDRSSGSSKSVKPAAAALLTSAAIDLFSPAPAPTTQLPACQLYYHSHPTPLARDDQLITSPESSSLLLQWPASQYMPATELGGVLGSSSHTQTPAAITTHPSTISPSVLLGLCNEALGQHQQETMDDMMITCSNPSKVFDHHSMDDMSCTDAVSAVNRDDEKARLGTAAMILPFTTTAAATPSNVVATSSALADQLQGLLDAGLLQGGAAPPPPSATVVAVSRDDETMCTKTTSYSFPATMHLNVKMFGEAAVLVRYSGEPVLVDDSGVTVEPLQQGATYYVLVSEEAVH